MGGVRHLPLALQWAYTSGACGLFATVVIGLDSCRGGVARAFEDDDDGYHIAVALPDGRYVDAEGIRDRDDIIDCFGMTRESLRESDWKSTHAPAEHERHLLALLLRYGWNDRVPLRMDGRTASSSPRSASNAFERMGGMSSSPIEIIGRYMKAAA